MRGEIDVSASQSIYNVSAGKHSSASDSVCTLSAELLVGGHSEPSKGFLGYRCQHPSYNNNESWVTSACPSHTSASEIQSSAFHITCTINFVWQPWAHHSICTMRGEIHISHSMYHESWVTAMCPQQYIYHECWVIGNPIQKYIHYQFWVIAVSLPWYMHNECQVIGMSHPQCMQFEFGVHYGTVHSQWEHGCSHKSTTVCSIRMLDWWFEPHTVDHHECCNTAVKFPL